MNPQKITKNTNTNTNINEKKEEVKEVKEKNDLNFYSKLKLKQIEPKINTKKNVTWDDDNQLNNNMALIIKEMLPINTQPNINEDKMDTLINKVDVLIELMTSLTNKLNR